MKRVFFLGPILALLIGSVLMARANENREPAATVYATQCTYTDAYATTTYSTGSGGVGTATTCFHASGNCSTRYYSNESIAAICQMNQQ